MLDRVQDGRRWPIHWQLADSFGPAWAKRIRVFFEVDTYWRQVRGSRHNVIRHLPIRHPPLLPDDIFIQRIADGLRHATFDLASSQHRINYATNLLHRDEIVDPRFIS